MTPRSEEDKSFESWEATDFGDQASKAICHELDIRVARGPFPVTSKPPANPPPPVGWSYWKEKKIPSKAVQLTVDMLKDSRTYPMGSFVQMVIDGELIAARVEWHDIQGATGKRGCFRGVNLMRKYPEGPSAA